MEEKVDRRVIRTRKAIQKSFEELATTHDYHDITIKELAEKANINRRTFYLHFDSIEDLVNSYVNEVTQRLVSLFKQRSFKENYEHPGQNLTELISLLQESKDFWSRLLFSDEYSFFTRKIERMVAKEMTQSILASFSINRDDAKLCANFLIQNTLSTLRFFINDQRNTDYDQIQNKISRLNTFGISTFLDKFSSGPQIENR
ncbi:TetR/AcrR family transcriptional regulator [Lentilactobacillus hilgardii]|uniref:TetR/AcrR family transcriptional regulator n=1 Tax=Lentilactobacillus hilgardii TaxID=1588 RepID=UPI0021C3E76E|nr:TetR/AcrR family transcriptional regulator [Lentilactobacillus hilgardii]MCP9333684.1 TetR/AcrR family transcriptional regulator [Lentilactobacillus hilgardii]MCP9350272.1 TetR/AcrR family transcriptional regulator [Lentilactobacillus hilgardii]MCP9353148.1 TetR/AcrR family transcriptional regulator [Lentilactobacillus hilgardii]